MIKAILFDLDGVLVDADYWHYEALNRALAEYGHLISQDQHLHFYKGIPTRTKLKILSIKDGLPVENHEDISRKKQEHSIKIIDDLCKPVAEKIKMMTALNKKGYRMAVCTNSIRHTAELMLYKSGLLDKVEFIISNEDVKNPKPHPEVYLKAFERFAILPSEALIVEDSAVGLKSAQASGAFICKVAGPDEVNIERIEQALKEASVL